jgi:hypothetical protein
MSFRWKDDRFHDRQKTMTLAADEVMRRFLLHVLPDAFHHIRQYGCLGNRFRASKLALCRQLLGVPSPVLPPPTSRRDYRDVYEQLTGISLRACPLCQHGHMVRVGTLPPAGRALPRRGPR